MDVFAYLQEEQALVLSSLKELVQNFSDKSREEVFDEVKLVCDKLRAYLKKYAVLVLDELEEMKFESPSLKETKERRDQLLGDLENLVMVHVDEPGYRDYLANLLEVSQDYFDTSNRLSKKLSETLPKATLDKLNEKLRTIIHSDVGFNSLQTPEAAGSAQHPS
jgi:hypothetical protein